MPDTLELLWLDPKRAARIRRQPAWQRLLDEARKEPPTGDPLVADRAVSADDRTDLLLVLARGHALDGPAVRAALSAGIREDGKFAPPLVLVGGELQVGFGEVETLKTTVANALPFTSGDEALKSAVDSARELLQLPGFSPAPGSLQVVIAKIRAAFAAATRTVPPSYLEEQTARALLEHRHYQVGMFAGAPHLRASLQPPGVETAMLTYVPEKVGASLPLQRRFAARLIAEACLSADPQEAHSFSLGVLALARQIPPPVDRHLG